MFCVDGHVLIHRLIDTDSIANVSASDAIIAPFASQPYWLDAVLDPCLLLVLWIANCYNSLCKVVMEQMDSFLNVLSVCVISDCR